MKPLFLVLALLSASLVNAQAFIGKEDQKFQVGLNTQKNATGINASYDYGLGENISIGLSATYALGVKKELDASFDNRFDARARFNANIGNVLEIDDNFDFYPGLSFGLKNFGGHLGARYFFSEGFGLFTEAQFPIAKYKTGNLTPAENLHNQFSLNFGASFNIM